MDAYSEAVKWVSQGIAVFPIPRGRKIPRKDFSWYKFQNQLPANHELVQWFRPRIGFVNNLAVVTGWNNLIVLDFDDLDIFFAWWPEVNNLLTYMVLTRRGIHVYLFCDDLPQSQNFNGGNLQARGRYVLGVPSLHPSGAVYQVIYDRPILHVRELDEILPAHYRTRSEYETKSIPVASPPIPSNPRIMTDPWETAAAPQSGNLVATIKDRISLLSFFPDAKPTKNGWFVARCPFHDDHNPSMWIDTKRALCGCYAGCTSKSMDVINFYARLNNISDRQAIDDLGNLIRKG